MTKDELIEEVYQTLLKEDGGNPVNEPWLEDTLRYQAKLVIERLEELNMIELN